MHPERKRHPEAEAPSDLVPLAGLFTPAEHSAPPMFTPAFEGADVLSGASPSEVLARLVRGDPLGVGLRCHRRRRERATLIDPARLTSIAMARVARSAMQYRGEPELDAWLVSCVDLAIDDARTQDREAAADAVLPADPQHFDFAAKAWNVEARVARDACSTFNDLPDVVRVAYWRAILEGKGLARGAEELGVRRKIVEARVKRAIVALGTLRDPGGDDNHAGDFHAA
jgi:DNA-directed RNA polymerase specialized sigma24 family protein